MRQLAFTVTDQYPFRFPLRACSRYRGRRTASGALGYIQLGKHHLHTVVQIGSDKATVVPFVETLETTMLETPYHSHTVKCLWSLVNRDGLRHGFGFAAVGSSLPSTLSCITNVLGTQGKRKVAGWGELELSGPGSGRWPRPVGTGQIRHRPGPAPRSARPAGRAPRPARAPGHAARGPGRGHQQQGRGGPPSRTTIRPGSVCGCPWARTSHRGTPACGGSTGWTPRRPCRSPSCCWTAPACPACGS